MSNQANVILDMEHITKEFPGVKALDQVDLSVQQGAIHAICGENGAGKSTLMKVLSGVYAYGTYDGTISFDNKVCTFSNIRQSEAAGIVIIHQELALIPELSIAENIFLGNEQVSKGMITWDDVNAKAAKLMEQVGLNETPTTKIKDIGVGKQQLVEIAKALSKNVRLLILDEPTAALNEQESAHLLDLMRQQRDKGMTQIIISHKLNEIEAVADAVTIIRDGKSIKTLSVAQGNIDEDEIIKAMVGRAIENRYPPHEPNIGDVLLEVKDWWVEHPINRGRMVCKGSNIVVRKGEVVGLAGLMGAGRTELVRSLYGHSYGIKHAGEIFKHGKKIDTSTVKKAIAQGISYVSEDRKELGLNLLDDIHTAIVSAKLSKISKRGVVDQFNEIRYAKEYRESVNIKAPSVFVGVNTLSGGNQQKVVLSKSMFTDPDILILDEPTRGIDVGAKYEIYTIIHELADAGLAVILVSSELPELLGMSDRIYTIFEGEVTGEMDAASATQVELMKLMTASTANPAPVR